MKKHYFFIFSALLFFSNILFSQTFDGEWSVEYVTSDNPDSINSTGNRTISVATIAENSFVALVNRASANSYYLVGYRDAAANAGRLGNYAAAYGAEDFQTKWIDGFSQEFVYDANDLAVKDNMVYVANNFVANNGDINNSILVFEVKDDSVYTHPQRYKVGEYIWGIDIDGSGRLYVTKTGDSLNAGSVLILDNPDGTDAWISSGSAGKVLQEITLPEIGSPRGITVNNDGTVIYVSNWDENKVYCYVGNPAEGYTLYNDFDFSVDKEYQTSGELLTVGPHGVKYLSNKNLLFIAHDGDFGATDRYEYGRIYVVNPNSGVVLDTVDVAEWNFSVHNSYTDRNSAIASGFASVFNVDFDENFNLYTQSHYGWTVEKWIYSGELPTIELTITSIEKIDATIPSDISLKQNYPNPFNPTTTIEFHVSNDNEVSISVYNINGQLVSNLVNTTKFSAGIYKITFDASNLSSGNYFYKLTVGDKILTKKMTLLK